jgi:3',5'-cyclic AMP phosphodiesterase CpdA
MRIVHLSDLHLGAISPGLPEALIASVAAVAPDMTVISGDLTQRGRRSEYLLARELMSKLPAPLFVVPGNHDMPHGLRLWSRFRNTFSAYQTLIQRELEPLWMDASVVIAGLNSAVPGGWYLDWDRGRICAHQLIELRRKLAGVPHDALRVLVIHHPPASPPGGTKRHLLDNRTALFGALNEIGIDLVLSGHFHLSYAMAVPLPGPTSRSCVLSVTSTATSTRLKGEPNGFHVIETSSKSLTVHAHTWGDAGYSRLCSWCFRCTSGRDWRKVAGISEIGSGI